MQETQVECRVFRSVTFHCAKRAAWPDTGDAEAAGVRGHHRPYGKTVAKVTCCRSERMIQRRWYTRRLITLLLCFCTSAFAHASSYFGQITFGGLPVPGATITATQGTKTIAVTSDEGGVFHFDDLPDGQWKIEITMLCFQPIDADVTIAPKMSAAKYELQLLPTDQLQALAKAPPPQPNSPQPTLQAATEKKSENGSAQQAPPEIPKPPDDTNQQSSDG